MEKNNDCVIYDSDVQYATRLMAIINKDNNIPFNAQIFTEESELEKYLSVSSPGLLMIQEDSYGYDIEKAEAKRVVVLCEDEGKAKMIEDSGCGNTVGVFKYQPSHQIIKTILAGSDLIVKKSSVGVHVYGVYGVDDEFRNISSLSLAHILSIKSKTLYINLDEFSGLTELLPEYQGQTLSDALYLYKQNHLKYHKGISSAIGSINKLDYFPPVACADDISYIDIPIITSFMDCVGRELGYENIVVDLSDGIKTPWNIMKFCDEVFIAEGKNYVSKKQQNSLERYLAENGMEYLINNLKRIEAMEDDFCINSQFWENVTYSSVYKQIKECL